MTYLNACTALDDQDKGQFNATVHLRPVAYLRDGGYRAIAGKLAATGDAAFALGADELIAVKVASHIQGNAPLWEVRDGSRKAWARWALEGANRVEGKASSPNAWLFPEALPGADLSIVYGGHRVAADFALREGHPKAFTWRLDAQEGWDPKALTLGDLILAQPVLLPPEGELRREPIPLTWEIGSKGGRYTLTCALPDGDWAGWTLDPTLVIQPAAAAGLDTYIYSGGANQGSVDRMWCQQTATGIRRALIKFDLSAIPDEPLSSVYFSLKVVQGNTTGGANIALHRQKRPWSEMEATWVNYATGQAWATAGGFGADDCEQSTLQVQYVSHRVGMNARWSWSGVTKAALDLGHGWMLKYYNESGSYQVAFASSDYATASSRPTLTISWHEGSGGAVFASGVFHSGAFGNKVMR